MIVVGAASAAMVAAVQKAADRVVAAVEKVEEAVYSYSDAVGAAERRQDKAAGCRSDVARHIVQAVVQYNRCTFSTVAAEEVAECDGVCSEGSSHGWCRAAALLANAGFRSKIADHSRPAAGTYR